MTAPRDSAKSASAANLFVEGDRAPCRERNTPAQGGTLSGLTEVEACSSRSTHRPVPPGSRAQTTKSAGCPQAHKRSCGRRTFAPERWCAA